MNRMFYKLRDYLLQNMHDGYNLGVVVLDKCGGILGWGFNSYVKTHPKMCLNKHYRVEQIFIHAEADTLYSLSDRLTPHTMLIARINRNGDFLNARPCVGCYAEIQKRGLKKVLYTVGADEVAELDMSVDVDSYY